MEIKIVGLRTHNTISFTATFQSIMYLGLFIFFACIIALNAAPSADDIAWLKKKIAQNETAALNPKLVHVLRLGPGEDLVDSLWKYARCNYIKAASIVSVVGSLTTTNIRYANQEGTVSLNGHFEIVSVVGNIDYQKTESSDYEGSGHIHLSVSDENGVTIGGHAMPGNIVYTTAEITILEIDGLFDRILDDGEGGSGYYELKVFYPKE